MDGKDRQARIERMKREKQRQERMRQRRKVRIKQGLAVAVVVGLFLLLISGIWALAKPLVQRQQEDKARIEAQGDIESEENSGATNPNDEPEADESPAEQRPAVTPDPAMPETRGAEEFVANNDGPAAQKPIEDMATVKHAVPGWQVDDAGWWYANADNTYYENGWATLNGQKYFFNQSGYMQTGWAPIGGKGCFFDKEGQYQPDKERKMVALTFDDGPGKYTERLLDILDENNAKATFFMLGQCIGEEHGYLVDRMKQDGHELGNHTYTHTDLTTLSESEMQEEFDRTDEKISEVAGGSIATVARTPYGAQDEVVLRNIGKPAIYWDIDTRDWQTKDVEKNVESAMTAKEGSIILMHDIHETTVQACEQIIPKLIEQGYELVTVTELARAHGVEMKSGVTYYAFTEEHLQKIQEEEAARTTDSQDESQEADNVEEQN